MKTLKKNTVVQTSQHHKDTNPKSLSKFLQLYRIQKGEESKKITNTRIGNIDLEIYGGKYAIPDEKYEEFLRGVYYHEVFVKNQPEYLTETQLEKGPLLVDVDLRHEYSVTTRQYTLDDIGDLIDIYLGIIKKIYQLDDEAVIQAYLFQKQTVNRVEDDQITKDGLHIIFTLNCDHTIQQYIRQKVIEQIGDIWTNIPITNTWDKVFDEGISQGTTNWQLVGSRKPGNEAYRLTGIYTATFDSSDQEFSVTFADSSTFDMSKDIFKLSARYIQHYEPFMTTAFLAEHNRLKDISSTKPKRSSSSIVRPQSPVQEINPLSIKNQDDLDVSLKQYLDSLPAERYKEFEAYSYSMTLPIKYYGQGSYDKWFAVGCALRNISRSLFIVFLAFSAQSPTFSFADIPTLWDQWNRFEEKNNGLTLRSLIYYSKIDALEKYKEVRRSSLDYYIEQSLDNGLSDFAVSDKKSQITPDWDIASVLYQMKKDQFVCASVKANEWYHFRAHRWVEIDSGTSLRTAISTELRQLYGTKAQQLTESLGSLEDEDDPKYKYLKARIEKAIDIYARLGRTTDKRNIMEAAKDMFYDETFSRKVDTNPHLLCCTNGVWDFKTGEFRDGKPEDYITVTTRLNYIQLTPKHAQIKQEIEEFFDKLFPIDELREYMWDHLSSTLVGTALNQTFNNYLGGGRNGKSVLVSLMSKTLGEYKGELPLTAVVTQKRTAVGGLAPEIACLKAKRYVVMQEPRQGDILNEGILKELTSGHDAIQARTLFSMPVTFLPQFKLVVCANVLPEIKAQDHGTWRRIRVVPFLALFTENPVQGDPLKPYQFMLDSTIDEKFDEWKEVFLSMLVDRVLKTNGRVEDCATVLEASKEYKKKQDVITQFLEDKIEDASGEWLKMSDVNNGFKLWLDEHGIRGPQPKEVHLELDKKYGARTKKGWQGARFVFDLDTTSTEIDNDDALF
jgi:P4 family phage/plasmid primase-like protien